MFYFLMTSVYFPSSGIASVILALHQSRCRQLFPRKSRRRGEKGRKKGRMKERKKGRKEGMIRRCDACNARSKGK